MIHLRYLHYIVLLLLKQSDHFLRKVHWRGVFSNVHHLQALPPQAGKRNSFLHQRKSTRHYKTRSLFNYVLFRGANAGILFSPHFKWSTFFSLYKNLTDDHKHLTRLVLNFIGGVESRELSAAFLQGSVCEAIKSLADLVLFFFLKKKKKKALLINWTWSETSDVCREEEERNIMRKKEVKWVRLSPCVRIRWLFLTYTGMWWINGVNVFFFLLKQLSSSVTSVTVTKPTAVFLGNTETPPLKL